MTTKRELLTSEFNGGVSVGLLLDGKRQLSCSASALRLQGYPTSYLLRVEFNPFSCHGLTAAEALVLLATLREFIENDGVQESRAP